MAKRVILIRHGQTDWNLVRRWQGMEHSVPLNAEGRGQAQRLADYLQDRPIATIVSSDLLRAWETATIIGQPLNINPQADIRWRERDVGVFQGLTWDEVVARYPQDASAFKSHDPDHRIPGGETGRELQQRALAGWGDHVDNDAGGEIVVVSHGGTIRNLLVALFPDDSAARGTSLANTSMSTIEREGAGWRLVGVGQTPHLPG